MQTGEVLKLEISVCNFEIYNENCLMTVPTTPLTVTVLLILILKLDNEQSLFSS